MSASTLLTKSSGRNVLLSTYLAQLNAHPLRTKCLTLGLLTFLQEVLASHIAGVPVRNPPKDAPSYRHALAQVKVDQKALHMGLYGGLISAPLGHFLVGALQKAFGGRTSKWAKFGQLLASNLLVAPIQTVVYLSCMAVINGARSVDGVVKTVKGGFMAVIRVMWITGPASMMFAQRFLSPELWVPFFNLIGFTVGTYFNTRVKQLRLAAEKKARKGKDDGKTQ